MRVPVAAPRTKPKALNYALAQARGAFVAVYDAEDIPHPQQLRAALDAFASGGARLGAVQAPLLVDNGGASWLAGQFAAEYAIQFRGIVPLLAHLGAPPPLGGTSNHFRRDALEDAGGWDPFQRHRGCRSRATGSRARDGGSEQSRRRRGRKRPPVWAHGSASDHAGSRDTSRHGWC